VRVTLATGIPEATCKKINLGYRDWRTINKDDYANASTKASSSNQGGERLYHCATSPSGRARIILPMSKADVLARIKAEKVIALIRADSSASCWSAPAHSPRGSIASSSR